MEYFQCEIGLDLRIKAHFSEKELSMLVDIGYMLEKGDSLFEADHKLALGIYGLCANHGNPQAMNNYGWMKLKGFGCKKNIPQAIFAFKDAATRGVIPLPWSIWGISMKTL